MKRIATTLAVLAIAASAMAQGYPPEKMAQTLSMSPPVAGYFLQTPDGKINRWAYINNLLSGTAMMVTPQTGTVTATGANNLATINYAATNAPTLSVTYTTNILYGYDVNTNWIVVTNVFVSAVTATLTAASKSVATNGAISVSGTGLTNMTVAVP